MKDHDTLQVLADNPILFDAVRRLLERQFEVKFDLSYDDKTLGERLRARLFGLRALESAFRDIESCGSKREKGGGPVNPAR